MSSDFNCRECGISEIPPGATIEGEPLAWQDWDLCTRCHDVMQEQLIRDAARYRHLRNRPTRAVDMAIGGVFAGRTPDNLILGGEDLDRAVDAEIGAGVSEGETLERRLATCLAECIDEPILKGHDPINGDASLRLGFFRPELSARAAALLEEAGL